MRRRRSLISTMYSSINQVYWLSGGLRSLVNQGVDRDVRRNQDGNDVDHLDHGVDRWSGRVLVRIADRVTGDGRRVGLAALPSVVTVLDVLFRVIPGATARGHLNGEED